MVWDPQKPKIGPIYPPMDPNWPCSGTSSRHATRLVSRIRAQPYLTPSNNCRGVIIAGSWEKISFWNNCRGVIIAGVWIWEADITEGDRHWSAENSSSTSHPLSKTEASNSLADCAISSAICDLKAPRDSQSKREINGSFVNFNGAEGAEDFFEPKIEANQK